MTCGIYLITNSRNGMKYVGQSTNVEGRRSYHAYGPRRGKLAVAVKEHGWDAFTMEVIEECPPDQLNAAERRWIERHDCLHPRGYNSNKGGDRPGLGDGFVARTPAERQAAYAARGRAIAVVLRDDKAIAALDKLAARHGGVTAAVTFALHAAASRAKPASR